MGQAKVLSEAEFKRVLAVVKGDRHAARNRLAVMLSFLAGLRVGEMAQLKVGDVIGQNCAVRDQISLPAGYTKGREARTVFVNARLRRELQSYVRQLPKGTKAERPLLMTQKGTAFSANTLYQLFSQIYRKAGVDGASSHSGRRSFITQLAHNGTSAKVIMTLAGHKHLSTTQRYIEVNERMLRNAVERL